LLTANYRYEFSLFVHLAIYYRMMLLNSAAIFLQDRDYNVRVLYEHCNKECIIEKKRVFYCGEIKVDVYIALLQNNYS